MPESSHEQNMGYLSQILALQEFTQQNIDSCEKLAREGKFADVSDTEMRNSYAGLAHNMTLLLSIVRSQSELVEVLEGKLERAENIIERQKNRIVELESSQE